MEPKYDGGLEPEEVQYRKENLDKTRAWIRRSMRVSDKARRTPMDI